MFEIWFIIGFDELINYLLYDSINDMIYNLSNKKYDLINDLINPTINVLITYPDFIETTGSRSG